MNKAALSSSFALTLVAAYPTLSASGILAASGGVGGGVALGVGAAAFQRNAKEASPN